jgi:group I intron endonuclease
MCNSGIYAIRNQIDGKIYVGSSVDMQHRFGQHLGALRNNKHHNIHFQRAWNKYGEENFEFEVLEVVEDVEELISIEQAYLEFFDTSIKYNQRKFASSNLGIEFSDEWKKNLSLAHLGQTTSETQKKWARERWLGEKNPFYGKNLHEVYGMKLKCKIRKLNLPQVRVIIRLIEDKKLNQREIAEIFDVDQSTISNIKHKKYWKEAICRSD